MHGWSLGWWLLPEQVGGNSEPGNGREHQQWSCQYPRNMSYKDMHVTPCSTTALEHSRTSIPFTEALTQTHSIHAEVTQVPHMHIEHFPQQFQNLIAIHQLDTKPCTPMRSHTLLTELTSHPDRSFMHQLICNLQYGCDIGYTGSQFPHCSNNLPSSFQHPSTLDANITAECDTGRILGPFKNPPLPTWIRSGPQA